MTGMVKRLTATAAALVLCFSAVFARAAELAVENTEVYDENDSNLSDGAEETVTVTVSAKAFPAVSAQSYAVVLPAQIKATGITRVTMKSGETEREIEESDYSFDGSSSKITIKSLPETDGDYTLLIDVAVADKLTLGTFDVKLEAVSVTGADGSVEVRTVDGKIDVNCSTWIEANRNEHVLTDYFIEAGEPAFIPYGSVWHGSGKNIEFCEKLQDGKIRIDPSISVHMSKFRLPADGGEPTTFGVSENGDGTLQFGSYVSTTGENAEYGTMLIRGNFVELREYAADKSDDEILSRLAQLYDEKQDDKPAVRVRFGESHVDVYMVKQVNFMWRSGSVAGSSLQYALKVNNLSGSDDLFTAAGYAKADGSYTFSKEIQTARYPGKNSIIYDKE